MFYEMIDYFQDYFLQDYRFENFEEIPTMFRFGMQDICLFILMLPWLKSRYCHGHDATHILRLIVSDTNTIQFRKLIIHNAIDNKHKEIYQMTMGLLASHLFIIAILWNVRIVVNFDMVWSQHSRMRCSALPTDFTLVFNYVNTERQLHPTIFTQ